MVYLKMYVKTGVFRYMITAWLPELTSFISEATHLHFTGFQISPRICLFQVAIELKYGSVGMYVLKKFVRVITSPRIISIYCSTLYMVWFVVLGRWRMSIPYFMKGRFSLQTPKLGCFLQ